MSKANKTLKPLSLAIGATFVASMAASSFAQAAQTNSNPFAMHDLNSGYSQLADAKDGKCGANKGAAMPNDGKCGAKKMKCNEINCGAKKAKCEEDAKAMKKEGKCGGSK